MDGDHAIHLLGLLSGKRPSHISVSEKISLRKYLVPMFAINEYSIFADPFVRHHVIGLSRSFLLDASDFSFKQRNFDGTRYFAHCHVGDDYAIVGGSKNHRSR